MPNKPFLKCEKCGQIYHYKKERGWFSRNVLFWLPIKVFFCAKCAKDRQLVMTDEEYRRFEPV